MFLEQKTAVIYSAGGAIGGAVARAFARKGARVFLAGHTRAPLAALAQEPSQAGGVAEAAEVDALDAPSIEEHLRAVVEKTGGIAIAFNAISIHYTQGAPLVELAPETFSLGIADALQAQFLTSTAAARHMQQRGSGVILALTATPARMLLPNLGNFGVACAAIVGWCLCVGRVTGILASGLPGAAKGGTEGHAPAAGKLTKGWREAGGSDIARARSSEGGRRFKEGRQAPSGFQG